MKRDVFDCLLSKFDAHPILIDIGASGGPPAIWDSIARHSVYVGFDPGLAEIHEAVESHFYKSIIVGSAVTGEEGCSEVAFHFTKSPYCSSTLKPDTRSLSNFLYSDLFVVEREAQVPATTLNSVMERLSLSCIDWLKTDSQGTDLRIFNSLRPEIRSQVLAIDIEPGLIDAYVGEDLFVDAHRDLTQNGFWLSNLKVCGAVRMRRSTLGEITSSNKDISYEFVEKIAKRSPCWCEARYFRTIEWLAQGEFAKRDYVLLWVFALLDHQLGFALDLAIEYEKTFGRDDIWQLMKDEPVLRMRRPRESMPLRIAKALLPIRAKLWLKRFIQ